MMRTAVRAIAATVAAVLFAVSGSTRAGAVMDDPDIDSFATYEYRVFPDTGIVEVTIELAVTADKPNRSIGGGGYYQYYFPGYFIAVPEEAVDLTVADSGGRELSYEVAEEGDGVLLLDFAFRRNIFYRQTANVVVSFSLPPGDARTDALTRVNDAYAGFEVWLTPQFEGATVTVVTPEGFEDQSIGSDGFQRTVEDGQSRFVAEDVDPEAFWAVMSLTRDDRLVATELEVDGHTVEINAWPGDAAWTEHVTNSIEQGLPDLIDAVGLPWPVEDQLTIVESYAPYLSGYDGWYDLTIDQIDLGDELDTQLVFHELSHAWFNEELFPNRWITEGLASEFGSAMVEAGGDDLPDPTPTSLFDAAAQPLNQWKSYRIDDTAVEGWSYGASWTVTRAIVDEIGRDTVALAVQAAANDQISYLGDGEPEPGRRHDGWHRYLDLLENLGQVGDDEISELFVDWVLLDYEKPLLERRAESRDRYRQLADSGEEWAPPLVVRRAMSDWKFDAADELMDEAQQLLTDRAAVAELLAPLDGSWPQDLEGLYESAEDDLAEALEQMDRTTAAAEQLRATHDRLGAADGILQRVGAIGSDHPAELQQALVAFETGDLGDATAQARAIDQRVDGLTGQGIVRAVVVVTVVLLLVGLGLWRLRRRRARRAAAVDGYGQQRPTDPLQPQPSNGQPNFGPPQPVPNGQQAQPPLHPRPPAPNGQPEQLPLPAQFGD